MAALEANRLFSSSASDTSVLLTIALPLDVDTRAWRLQCLREAEGVESVIVDLLRARCGPFVLGDDDAVPALLYAFACAAADANEAPEVTFDEAASCLAFLQAVAQRRPGAADAAAKSMAVIERSMADSAPLSDEHRQVHETAELFSAVECRNIIAAAEAQGLLLGARHAAHATTDVSCLDAKELRWIAAECQRRVLPRFAQAFTVDDSSDGDFVLADLFVARYAADAQRALAEHEDGSPFAFVVPLNDGFEGGGTQFVELEGAPTFKPAPGAALLFSGKNRHRGVATTKGVRYILAGFVDVRERVPGDSDLSKLTPRRLARVLEDVPSPLLREAHALRAEELRGSRSRSRSRSR